MKTACDQTLLEISDHLDSGQKLSTTTQAHIQTCPDCASFLEAWQPNGYLTTPAQSKSNTLTTSLADQILEQLPTKQTPKIIRFVPALAAAAALAIGIFIWKSPTTTPQEIPTTAQTQPDETSPEKLPKIIAELEQQDLSKTITNLGHSSSNLINHSSRNIQKLTSKLEYVSTNLSKIIPRPTPENNLDTYIPTISDKA